MESLSIVKRDALCEESCVNDINGMLFYKKKEIIRYLNRNIPFFMYPVRYFKIKDMSFTVSEFGKVFIHLYLSDGDIETITIENNKIKQYCLPGLIMIGERPYNLDILINKCKEVFGAYLCLLERVALEYPNQTIYFGRKNTEFINSISESEKMWKLLK